MIRVPTHPLRGPAGASVPSTYQQIPLARALTHTHNSVTSQYPYGLPAYPGRQAPALGDPRPVSPRVLALRPSVPANRPPRPGMCGHAQGLLPPPGLHPNAREPQEPLPQAPVCTEAASVPVKPRWSDLRLSHTTPACPRVAPCPLLPSVRGHLCEPRQSRGFVRVGYGCICSM